MGVPVGCRSSFEYPIPLENPATSPNLRCSQVLALVYVCMKGMKLAGHGKSFREDDFIWYMRSIESGDLFIYKYFQIS